MGAPGFSGICRHAGLHIHGYEDACLSGVRMNKQWFHEIFAEKMALHDFTRFHHMTHA